MVTNLQRISLSSCRCLSRMWLWNADICGR